MKKMKKGFTIVELVIVIAVIGILSAILIPTFSNVSETAKDKAALSNARNEIIERYQDATTGNEIDDAVYFDKTNSRYVVIIDGQIAETDVYKTEAEAETKAGYTIKTPTDTGICEVDAAA